MVLPFLAAVLFGCGQDPAAAPPYRHVLLISVDGLRADAIADTAELPGFARLRRGPHSLNARCDFDYSITLPNHLSMVTGRSVLGPGGHQWIENGDPPAGASVHDRGGYLASVFDVAHDHGLYTAALVSKSKFSLFDASWGGERGAPDVIGADQGRDKIDHYRCVEPAAAIAAAAAEILQREPRTLLFLHFREPDAAGHDHGWDLSPDSEYRRAVGAVDRELDRLLDLVAARPELAGATAIVLTADHGGGSPREHHKEADQPDNYTIPFLIWLGPDGATADLYALNPLRADPGRQRQAPASARPPIRNGDAANLALELLGLPGVPGALHNAAQELNWR